MMPVSVDPHSRSVPREVRAAGDLAAVLRHRARESPNEVAFAHLHDGIAEEAALTYAELDARSRAVAARLHDMELARERVLLAYPPGLEFISGLFGCFYAGCVAVPTSLPYRRHRLQRFNGIVADAEPRAILSTASEAAQFKAMTAAENSAAHGSGSRVDVPWLATDEIDTRWAERWNEAPHAGGDEALAMLQYTSGSTSEPKGVMLTHANLMHNTRGIQSAFDADPTETSVFWLPTYHDMGLVGGVLAPVLTGIHTVTMSPTTFLKNPMTWLAAISRYRASISGGPNFAYDLCVRKTSEDERASLDLSSWQLAFVGAEPVDTETLERFADAFAPAGFHRRAFYPCYGLAEATLMVTGPKRGEGASIVADRLPLQGVQSSEDVGLEASARVKRQAPNLRVACGSPVGSLHVIIVDAETRTEVAPGEAGEVWVAGPSVGRGYWRKPKRTKRSFEAHLATGEGPFLRTGDLGFLHEGRFYITGRRDDLIIVRGVNRYPQDIETAARESHPLLEHHRGAAFSVRTSRVDRHVLVHEATRDGMNDLSPVLDAAAAAVLETHDVALDALVLVRSGTIPRTSSGKIQRHACRDAYLAGSLHVLAERRDALRANGPNGRRSTPRAPEPKEKVADDAAAFEAVREHALALTGASGAELTPETHLSALGLDSLQRVELAASLERTFVGRLPNTCDMQTLGELAEAVGRHLIDGRAGPVRDPDDVPREHFDPASFPELAELERYERTLRSVAGESPYFRIDEGGDSAAPHGDDSTQLRIGGRTVTGFCGYDYLGLSRDPEVAAAAKAAIDRYGTSAGASRLVSGEKRVHRELESQIARFLGAEDAVAFVSGHATNVTTIGHLLGPGDLIAHDLLAHNSIIQGGQLSGAERRRFPHNDWQSLDAMLSAPGLRQRYRRILIAIEGVYSMDGDWPDLPRFIELKRKHKAMLLVDEAHSLGTMGATGRGLGEHFGVRPDDVDIWMGTLSKALASCGGFIAGSTALVQYLRCTAPGFVYSVGLSPANAAAALAGLAILQREPDRVARLRDNASMFLDLARGRGLDTGLAAGSPIVPVIVGSSERSLRLSAALFNRGINVQPILQPAVAEHAARLRCFITVSHNRAQIREAVDAIAEELANLE